MPEAVACVEDGEDDAGSRKSYNRTNWPLTPATSSDGDEVKNLSDVIGSPGASLCRGSGIEEEVEPACFVKENGCK